MSYMIRRPEALSARSTRSHARYFTSKLSRSALPITTAPLAQELQKQLATELLDLNRGIFGVRAEQKAVIHDLIEKLEALNPLSNPSENLEQVEGRWILKYSTITIMGTKRSKLGLREFVKVGDMYQNIDLATGKAVNTVDFSVTGFGLVRGQFKINASFASAGGKRVNVAFDDAVLEPEQLQKLFQKNYDLLLSIFNPDGWLDITYVDNAVRVGRDSKGNVFYLERCALEP